MESSNKPDYQDDDFSGYNPSPGYNNIAVGGHSDSAESDTAEPDTADGQHEPGTIQPDAPAYTTAPVRDTWRAEPAGKETSGTSGTSGRRQLTGQQRAFVILIGLVFALIVIGGIGFTSGLFKPTPAGQPAVRADLAPPDPSAKALDGDNKYQNPFGSQRADGLNPTATAEASRSSEMITGRSMPPGEARTNEGLSAEEVARIKAMGDPGPANGGPTWAEKTPSKAQTRRETDQAIQRAQADQRAVTRQMYEVPRSPSQLAEERREAEEAAYRRKTTERLMSQMERASWAGGTSAGVNTGSLPGARAGDLPAGGNTAPAAGDDIPLNLTEYQSIKAAYGNDPARIPDRIRQVFSREIALDEAGKLPGTTPGTAPPDPAAGSTRILSTKDEVIPYRPTRNAFYGAGGQRRRPAGTASLGNLAVRAVVHGEAGEVSVMTGTSVAIRLVDDLQLLLNGDVVFFPANTLLSGICSINGERVDITVSSIRRGSYLYEAALEAYDMDGRRGIRVPNLQMKTSAGNVLAQSSQTVQPPFFMGNNQGAGQQIATQMGIQAGQSIFQGARNLILNRAQQVRVSIRPNYQILLRGAKYANPVDSGRQSGVRGDEGNP